MMPLLPMPFKKLHEYLKEKLVSFDILEPTVFQTKSIPIIKSGSNVYCAAPTESGKTTTLVLTTLQKLKCEAEGTAPRAIVLVKNREKAEGLYEVFMKYTRYNSLRIYLSHEKVHIDLQKSEIFEGVDVLIVTPESLNKLFLMNGISSSSLKIFSVDDAEFVSEGKAYSILISVSQSIQKCQYVFYSKNLTPKLKSLESYFMEYAKTIRC